MDPHSVGTTEKTKPRNQVNKKLQESMIKTDSLQFHSQHTLKHSLDEHIYKRRVELLGDEASYSRQEYQKSTQQCRSTTHPPGSEMGDSSL